jgi:hypothetical protein
MLHPCSVRAVCYAFKASHGAAHASSMGECADCLHAAKRMGNQKIRLCLGAAERRTLRRQMDAEPSSHLQS